MILSSGVHGVNSFIQLVGVYGGTYICKMSDS